MVSGGECPQINYRRHVVDEMHAFGHQSSFVVSIAIGSIQFASTYAAPEATQRHAASHL